MAFYGTVPGSKAIVTCDPGLYADSGDQEMTVRCRLNGQWSIPNPGCSSKSKNGDTRSVLLSANLSNSSLRI